MVGNDITASTPRGTPPRIPSMTALIVAFGPRDRPAGPGFALLNARDRRRDRAIAAVTAACPRPAARVRSRFHARAPVLSRRVVVTLNIVGLRRRRRLGGGASDGRCPAAPAFALVIGARLDDTLPVDAGRDRRGTGRSLAFPRGGTVRRAPHACRVG
jgi:hypothetical protein